MKRVYYFYGNDVFGKKEGRIKLFTVEIQLWIEDNIKRYMYLYGSNVTRDSIYGIKLYSSEDAMAFKLRWL